MIDPDPRITGKGMLRFEQAGVTVDKFPRELVEELLDLNRHFIRSSKQVPLSDATLSTPEVIDESIDLMGTWYGAWANPDGRAGEETIQVLKREANKFVGSFVDPDNPDVPVVFEGVLQKPYLRVQYHVPYAASETKGVMEDGSCFLKLQDDGSFAGFYAGFDNCGEYHRRRVKRRAP